MSPMLNRAQRILINEMPPHNVFLELFIGRKPILRLKRRAEINIGIDADPEIVAAAVERFGDSDLTIRQADPIEYLQSPDPKYPYRNEWLHPLGKELVYCALPRIGSNHRRETTKEYQALLLETLKQIPCMVIVASSWTDLCAHALADWRQISYKDSGGVEEFAWFNFPEPFELHDTRYLDNHREFERRAARWRQRFKDMPPLERYAMLQALQDLKQ